MSDVSVSSWTGIEGDCPGGTADVTYRFELSRDLIRRLDITA